MYETDEDFENQLMNKLGEIESRWKVFFNMTEFVKDILTAKIKRKIEEVYGAGPVIKLHINKI